MNADYGNTLINFAEKISLTPFPFAAGLGGNMKQMKRRIINIVSYEKPTFIKRVKGMTAFMLTAVLLLGFAPFISTYAADGSHYQWDSSSENISYVDLSTYFGESEGSFVLYDLENDAWSIHDMDIKTISKNFMNVRWRFFVRKLSDAVFLSSLLRSFAGNFTSLPRTSFSYFE